MTPESKMLDGLEIALQRQRNRVALGILALELPEHDFPPVLVDTANVRPIRPPQPPDLVA